MRKTKMCPQFEETVITFLKKNERLSSFVNNKIWQIKVDKGRVDFCTKLILRSANSFYVWHWPNKEKALIWITKLSYLGLSKEYQQWLDQNAIS